jgi:AAA domain, putative AbiEii toxin, Type IV TA system
MLRSFRVANHKSIKDEQELLLVPAYDKSRPVVPVAGIYGANAAGKSNLLDALRWMQYAVRSSYAEWEPDAGVPRTPFRLDPAAAAEPSLFSVELVLDGVRHVYGFEVDHERVREEWLYSYPRRRKRIVFRRGVDIRRRYAPQCAGPAGDHTWERTVPQYRGSFPTCGGPAGVPVVSTWTDDFRLQPPHRRRGHRPEPWIAGGPKRNR